VSVDRNIIGPTASNTWKKDIKIYNLGLDPSQPHKISYRDGLTPLVYSFQVLSVVTVRLVFFSMHILTPTIIVLSVWISMLCDLLMNLE